MDKFQVDFLNNKFKMLNGLIKNLSNEVLERPGSNYGKDALNNLNQIYSLTLNIEFFLKTHDDFDRYEFDDLVEYAYHVHHELSEVICKDDNNTSWLYSRVNQYADVYKSASETINAFL
ncbi:hypothetical protein ERX35_008005 [Macrococcus equipercicus]|uniref:DUF1798 family protein n=1 Tax=Macrococcus equipercicus TaxID=69967 RepID=A0ABQ6R7S8_9STAP|nr:hypothetical protein [Macrococcus equipercicus]KAA1039149.1 hypothetical protein ERX35_008005 [Macrococcus equipercicus]